MRRLLRTPQSVPEAELPRVNRFLREHDLPEQNLSTAARGETLSRLERQLPSGFPEMVSDQEFTSLIEGLVALPRSDELLRRLREGASLPAPVPPEPAPYVQARPPQGQLYGTVPPAWTAAPRAADQVLRGVHILWVDDHPRNNETLVNAFRAAGAVVRIAEDSQAADAALAVGTPTMVVSDIDRGTNPREGLEHIGRLRREGRYTGPVVFYAGRVTPERIALTQQLGAHLTSSGPEIERLVLRAAEGELPPPV
ncbi:response regulator [Streptomyces nigrescens]|uniref:Response regulator n=1 Tax=Streptomyces nigrescens TaxID=1920 RepID=A0A640TJC0_STRNI|nr:response regulator [Streptomyces libani]WAT96964.1 response regulator [Streptomyces libani subsp. libani]GFE22386.1 hypothetical protein Sliba_28390 [Streptomyces libani subsp. libani]GGV90790.1 hypothetical protein GCM10010500_19210 [Streptomyces libani subsp. libani]